MENNRVENKNIVDLTTVYAIEDHPTPGASKTTLIVRVYFST